MAYEHLRVSRETPLTDRHRRPYPAVRVPADIPEHARSVGQSLRVARQLVGQESVGGFDDRKLLKILLRDGDKTVPPFEAIHGIEIISQEADAVLLAFATDAALDDFEARLATLAKDGTVTRKDLMFVVQDFGTWAVADRTGRALQDQGLPQTDTFLLDVELWPQERRDKRDAIFEAFLRWARANHVEVLDELRLPSLLMLRLRCTRITADLLLRHRDVRTVDLPPRLGVSVQLLQTDINTLAEVQEPHADAPLIGVLDSGVTAGHPLLAPAVGDAQGFLDPPQSEDQDPWHGTFVAALALYGDIEEKLTGRLFEPELRLLTGQVFRDDGADETKFVEKGVISAVRALKETYGCRVFNLSYGDLNKVYDGRHVRGLAYTLDQLARELGVLFVVPTGNLLDRELPEDARRIFPDYLFQDNARLLDPATALNALTVGGVARHERTREAQRHPDTREDHPVARTGEPFPMTRAGPSISGAVKPDLVEHAGNVAFMRAADRTRHRGLGVVSLSGGFASGHPFAEDIGTSYAAPLVAHQAAKLLRELPEASPNLLRAVLGTHARWPDCSQSLLNPRQNAEGRDKLLRLVGYGQVDVSALFQSLDDTVTLFAEDSIAVDQHHFYELPIPASFWSAGRRLREVSVGLAYSPVVRTTRLEYRMSKLWFTLVCGSGLDEVTTAFRRNREEGMGERTTGRWLSNGARRAGTLQVSRWAFRQPIANGEKVFVVITRQDASWSEGRDVPEPYGLSIVMSDREQLNSTLYADIRALLQARVQVRERARI